MISQIPALFLLLFVLGSIATGCPADFDTSLDKPDKPDEKKCECTAKITDNYVFKLSLNEFHSKRDNKTPSCCDWTTDDCSKAPDKFKDFSFVRACQRHDFGYRNSKKQKRFTSAHRKKLDDQFKDDLHSLCDKAPKATVVGCKALANTYYAGVRICGGGDCPFLKVLGG
jgi:hypothetical protein